MTRAAAPRTDAGGEAAVFQVVEAIFVAVLVATALIFFALVQKPTPSAAGSGVDLARIAGDALTILQGDDPGGATDELRTAVVALRAGTTGAEDHARDLVDGALPDGLRFLLRASDGAGDRDCVYGPSAASYACGAAAAPEPRNAQGAVTYILDGSTLVLIELAVWNAF